VRSGALVASGLILALLGGGAGAYALSTDTVVVQDRADAVEGAPDLKRVAATRSSDGGVRLALSVADDLAASDLLADEDAGGPPGSICVRLWTVSRPGTTKPDLLACVTAHPDGKTLRATISKEVAGALPSTVGRATLTRPSDTSLALRIRADVLGRPRRVAFAGEATGPGCTRLSCVDLAPDGGATKTLRLR
jgi:hypothetical protein